MRNEAIRKQGKQGSWQRRMTPPRAEEEANKCKGMGQILASGLLPYEGRRAGNKAQGRPLNSNMLRGNRK